MTMIIMTTMTMTMTMMKVGENGEDLTFSHNQETEKQDHGVTRKDEVAAIFLEKKKYYFKIHY